MSWSPSRCFTRKGFTTFGGFPGTWYYRQALQGCRGFPCDSTHSLGWLNLLLLGIVMMDWSLGWGLTSLKGRDLYPNHPLDKGMQARGFRKAGMSLNFSAFPFNSKSTNLESLFWIFLMFFFSSKGENKVVGQGSQRFGRCTINLFGAYFIKEEAQTFGFISQIVMMNLCSHKEGLHL